MVDKERGIGYIKNTDNLWKYYFVGCYVVSVEWHKRLSVYYVRWKLVYGVGDSDILLYLISQYKIKMVLTE